MDSRRREDRPGIARPRGAGSRERTAEEPADARFDAGAVRRHAGDAARLLKALGHRQRLQVLCLLADSELSVGQINECIDLSQSALSQQLARLRADRLVTTRREAQTIYYRLASGPARELMAALHAIYCAGPAGGDPAQRRRR